MQVKSIAECSKGSILQYFRPSLSYHLSLRLFLSTFEWPLKTGFTVIYIFRVNDQLLRVNNNDVSNVDKKFAIGAMRSRSGIVNLVIITIVRRKATEWESL